MEQPPSKRAHVGSMPPEMKQVIEKALQELGQVEYNLRKHRKGPGPVRPKTLPPEALVHQKTEEIRQGSANRIHYMCSNEACPGPIRHDKWHTHVIAATSDHHLQEDPAAVLERSCDFAPDVGWCNKDDRMERVVTFMEMRHFLSLARQYDETELAKKLTEANRFYVRLTNMVRNHDPTSRTFLKHYAQHYKPRPAQQQDADVEGELAELLVNIVFARNTMSKEIVQLCEEGKLPWLRLEGGRISEDSKNAVDEVFLSLNGKVFFQNVQPMKDRSKAPRRGWSEFASELVGFAGKARALARVWHEGGDTSVAQISAEIRKISGFGGKGFRMKEIVLDLAEATSESYPAVRDQLVDFGVVGPGPRRALNFVNNRRWFDNERDKSPECENMCPRSITNLQNSLSPHACAGTLVSCANSGSSYTPVTPTTS